MTTLFTILFDGVAYGMLLFVLACGLAVTLGLMNFVNLAHGAFAMAGGYVCAVLVNRSGWPFFASLPLAFVASALMGAVLERARFGSRLRAAVDDPRAAIGLGINVPQVFAFTFAFGCGLAGLGGALSAEILGLDPYFPLKFMIYFLIVVTVGGSSSITGPFLASLLLGIGDVAGKYYVPKIGPFVIYTIMIVILIWRPNGLFGRTATR